MQLAVQWTTWRNNAQMTACIRAKITYGLQFVSEKTEIEQSEAASTAQPDARAEQKKNKKKQTIDNILHVWMWVLSHNFMQVVVQ